jgi:hypothetical protein
MEIPSHLFTLEDFTLLGYPICHMILTTQAAIRNHRLLVAYNPLKPPHHEATCKKPMVTCQCNWDAAWWDGLARLYLHPDFPASPQDILLKLENTPIMGVTAACRAQAIDIIKQQRVFEWEDDMKEETLWRIQAMEGTVIKGVLCQ